MLRLFRTLALWTLALDGLLVATLLIDRLLGLIAIVYGGPLVALGLAACGLVATARGRERGVRPLPGAVASILIPALGWVAALAVAYANRITHL